MEQWWTSLSQRERIMVGFAAVAGVLFLFYQFVFLFLGTWRADVFAQRAKQKLVYEQVILAAKTKGNSAKANANALNPDTDNQNNSSGIDTNTPLKSALDQSARRFGLIISSTDGNDNQGVQISLAACDPDRFYEWLTYVKQQYGATVTQVRLGRTRNNKALIKPDRLVFARSFTPNASVANATRVNR